MTSHIEIEERALCSKEQHADIFKHINSIGTVKTSRRVMINYTALDYDCQKTVELRLNDGQLTKVIKEGAFGGTVHEETSQINAPLQTALNDMAKQGYTNAKVSLRIRHVVASDGYEYCLRDVLRYDDPSVHSYPSLFEIEFEKADAKDDENIIRENIKTILKNLSISAVSFDEFKQWSEFNHTQVDGDFIYSPHNAEQLAATLASYDFYQLP